MATRVIDKRVCRGQQDVDYVEVLTVTCKRGRTITPHKLRVKIRSDAYAFQSYARVERWDGDKWHAVHDLGYSNMKTPIGLSHASGDLEAKFTADRDELVKLAEAILS